MSGSQGYVENSPVPWCNHTGQRNSRGGDLLADVDLYRRLIMDGALKLTRVVRKAVVSFEAINAHGDASTVQVDCLAPELTPRSLVGILCNDLLVLCRDPSEGRDPNGPVDLWAVLRMQTVAQPASIVHGNGEYFFDSHLSFALSSSFFSPPTGR